MATSVIAWKALNSNLSTLSKGVLFAFAPSNGLLGSGVQLPGL